MTKFASTTLAAAAAVLLGLASCSGSKGDENATVVNVEKGVASPVWTSDGGQAAAPAPEAPEAMTAEEPMADSLPGIPEAGAEEAPAQ